MGREGGEADRWWGGGGGNEENELGEKAITKNNVSRGWGTKEIRKKITKGIKTL